MALWHESAGEGMPVLLLHAGICDSRMWEPQWQCFSGAHRTIRCDLRGFGRTALPPHAYSSSADVAALCEALELGPAAVVGASYGGDVALDLALSRPELVSRLVLVDSALEGHAWAEEVRAFGEREDAALARGDLEAAVEENLSMWVDGPHRTPGEVDPQLRALVGTMQARAFELQLAAGDEDPEELSAPGHAGRLGEIAVPALALTGELDVDDMQEIADRLAAEIPGARRARVAGAAHLPSLERPAEFDRLVLGFLD